MTTTHLLTIALDDSSPYTSETIADVVHRFIEGSHTLASIPTEADVTEFEWDDVEIDTSSVSRDDPYLTVVTTIDQDAYLEAYASGQNASDPLTEDHHDLVHRAAQLPGLPLDCSLTILAVSGPDFVVRYTTRIDERDIPWACDCGEVIERGRDTGDVQCPECGQEFNAFGQRLSGDWRSNPSARDEQIGDLEGDEMSHDEIW